MMNEQICRFGPLDTSGAGKLMGILSRPTPETAIDDAPVVIILNAGIVHRIGPFRLHVDFARRFARLGFSTLRMDMSGLGDSLPRSEQSTAEAQAKQDVADAMDFLQERCGATQFVVVGLCSGAYNAHQIAKDDDRIVGAVFLDGIVFRTLGFYLRHYGLRFLKPRFWRNAIKRRLGSTLSTIEESAGQSLGESQFFDTSHLERQVVADEIRGMLDRGVQTLFVFTDGYDDICSKSQFGEMYGLQPDSQLQVDYFAKAEHTFRLVENREALVDRVASWLSARFNEPNRAVSN